MSVLQRTQLKQDWGWTRQWEISRTETRVLGHHPMSEILMNWSLWQSRRAELHSHITRHWVNSVIRMERIHIQVTKHTVQCVYVRTQCSAFMHIHSAMPLCTYTVQCLYVHTQCSAFMHIHSAMPLCTYTVQCRYVHTQCSAFMYIHSAVPLCTYTVQCLYVHTQCSAFMHIHSAMPLCTYTVQCLYAHTQYNAFIGTIVQFGHKYGIPHLRIIMVTSELAPPKATVKAWTVTKKARPDGAMSKSRITLVSEVFCASVVAPEMETL